MNVICRYQLPKHIKIYQNANGQYSLTEVKAFNSIPVITDSSAVVLSCVLRTVMLCHLQYCFLLLCQLSKVVADILTSVYLCDIFVGVGRTFSAEFT